MSTKLVRIHTAFKPSWNKAVLAVGNFDGVHVGHQDLLRRVVAEAAHQSGAVSIVQSFSPHPAEVLNPDLIIRSITGIRKKLQLLTELKVDYLGVVRFNRAISQLSAEDYINEYWIRRCRACHVVLGSDTALGKARKGDVNFIKNYLDKLGVGTTVVELKTDGVDKYGSRKIRKLVTDGDLVAAKRALGRNFSLIGRVVSGDQRGRKIGFKTANVHTGLNLIPRRGVYACKAILRGKEYQAVANIGVRPTFGGGSREVTEIHLLDYSGDDFYGERLEAFFEKHLRDERKFSSMEELRSQIDKDVEKVRGYFSGV
jgi:riboflavin kinase/FMN adenylyltransferase